MVTVFSDATLVDGTGAQPREHATIVVDGDRIAEVTSGDRPYRGQAADTVDCAGRTLLPGLIDAHVHAAAIDVNILEQHRAYPPSVAALHTARILTETLAQGFTTVRDAGGTDRGFADAIDDGLVHGPRLRVSGAPISQTGGHGDPRRRTEHAAPAVYCPSVGMRSVVADGADEVRKAVREQLRAGAHQIKVMASGGAMSPTDELDTTQYSVDELRAAVDEATAAGTYVLAHAYSSTAVRNCIAAGVRSVEHGNLIDAETARALADAGVYLVPTLVTYDALAREGADYGVPTANIAKINEAREQGLAGLRHAADAGVRIGSGSDLLGPLHVHKARELMLKAQVLGPLGALVAATQTNAELLGLADEIGTIEAGKAADLLVVDGDVLHNLELLTDPAKLEVFMGGRRVPSG